MEQPTRQPIGAPKPKLTKEEKEAKRKEREEKARQKKAEKEERRRIRLQKAAEKKAEAKRKELKKLQERAEYLANRVELCVKADGKVIACFRGVKEIQLPAAEKAAVWLSRKHGESILWGEFNNEMTGQNYKIFKEYSNGTEAWMS